MGTCFGKKSYGGTQIDQARSIIESDDGNFLIVGDSRSNDVNVSNSKGAADMWLIKIDNNGNILWEKSYGGTSFDVARQITATIDNGYLLVGSSRSQDGDVSINQGQNDFWIVKIDNSGNIKWQKTVGGSGIDFAYSVVEMNDERIIMVGESNSSDGDVSENKGFTDLLITKIKLE